MSDPYNIEPLDALIPAKPIYKKNDKNKKKDKKKKRKKEKNKHNKKPKAQNNNIVGSQHIDEFA